MKKLSCIAVAALVFSFAGCGGPPTDSKGKGLSVTAPSSVSVVKGKTQTFKVSVNRAGMTDPIKLVFAGLPEGVTVEEKDPTIKKDDPSGTFTLKAADDAKETSDAKATVKAEGGGKTTEAATFTVKVTAK